MAIVTPTDDPRAIGAEGQATDPCCVRAIHPPERASCHVPDQHALQKGAPGQQVSIRTPGHPGEDGFGVVAVLQDLDTGPGDWVPQPDGMLPPSAGQQAAVGAPRDAVHAPAMSM